LLAIKATLIPTLLPWEKGFYPALLKVMNKYLYINPSIGELFRARMLRSTRPA
jgi:hypothetical protein